MSTWWTRLDQVEMLIKMFMSSSWERVEGTQDGIRNNLELTNVVADETEMESGAFMKMKIRSDSHGKYELWDQSQIEFRFGEYRTSRLHRFGQESNTVLCYSESRGRRTVTFPGEK